MTEKVDKQRDKCRQSNRSQFSRTGISPLNEIICLQIWQHLNFALLDLTMSFRRLGQQTRLSIRWYKWADNNSDERKFEVAREATCTYLHWNCKYCLQK
jgi:hypothetical protein